MSAIDNEPLERLEQDVHSVLWVQQVVGREALVDNDSERWKMRFYGEVPLQGSLIGVWHRPVENPIVLKGAIDQGDRSESTRRPNRSVVAWECITEPQRLTTGIV